MSRRYYKLPPLTSLATFETAARHRSFKGAAEELGVTPGAVSHQIKALEDCLGVKLYHREKRKVFLSEEGQKLLPSVDLFYTTVFVIAYLLGFVFSLRIGNNLATAFFDGFTLMVCGR